MRLNRDDNVELRKKILNMISEKRKKFGINKSTLWHIKRNLNSRKTINVYNKVFSKINHNKMT